MQPYPSHLVRNLTLPDGTAVTVRPIRPEDAGIEQEFVRSLSDESRYFRFMDSLRELSPRMLANLTQVDYDCHMALVVLTGVGSGETEIAVARYVIGSGNANCEFAIVVADAWQRRGVGTILMRELMDAARRRNVATMFGEVLASNHKMLRFMRNLGFRAAIDPADPHVMRVEITL